MAVTVARRAVEVRPITRADERRVAEFLHAHMNARVPAERWEAALDTPWTVERPNAGFMLVDRGAVVGAHLAFYSERTIDGRRERFCNLAAWCVLPDYRLDALRLLKALLAQDGYHFVDLSPSGSVVGINSRLGFRFLDATAALMPNLPWPAWRPRHTISSDPAVLERVLTGRELQLYRDHAAAQAARHLVLIRGDESCYVVLRADRFKRVPRVASILHASNAGLLRAMARPLARHLLLRHGMVATIAEERIAGRLPWPSVRIRGPRPRMYRSPVLGPAQVDYLYSELTCLSW